MSFQFALGGCRTPDLSGQCSMALCRLHALPPPPKKKKPPLAIHTKLS
ncbi:unnamed protein product, partial [Staurois parvus]